MLLDWSSYNRYHHGFPFFKDLQWLPIAYEISHNLFSLEFKPLSDLALVYFSNLYAIAVFPISQTDSSIFLCLFVHLQINPLFWGAFLSPPPKSLLVEILPLP